MFNLEKWSILKFSNFKMACFENCSFSRNIKKKFKMPIFEKWSIFKNVQLRMFTENFPFSKNVNFKIFKFKRFHLKTFKT
jgi:hypothetical protein